MSETEEPGGLGPVLLKFTLALGMVPVNALVSTWGLGRLWDWFLSPQYGVGPTSAAWFGIASAFGTVFMAHEISLAKVEGWGSPTKYAARAMALPIGVGAFVLTCWLVGRITGWIG
jgi:hypothetical protein